MSDPISTNALRAIIGLSIKPVKPPKEVVIVEHWYDPTRRFKILVDGEYWFYADTKEIAESIAAQIRDNKFPKEIQFY